MSNADARAWQAAISVIDHLRQAGHTALLAGGCVRDRIMGRTPKDYDVVTDATPQRLCELFPRGRRVGVRFGVLLVRRHGIDIEVATFRTDGSYRDGRHPESISPGTPEEDAHRRDFTINGLFLDPLDDRVIDYVGGQADIRAQILRTIGDPDRRFSEDHLRMLRAVRFTAALGFTLDEAAFRAIQNNAARLADISPERIWQELELILTHPSRGRGWRLLLDTHLRGHLAPPWPADQNQDLRAARRLEALPDEPLAVTTAFPAVVCEQPRGNVVRIGRALRLSNRLIDAVAWLVDHLPAGLAIESRELADLKTMMAGAYWPDLVRVVEAEAAVRNLPDAGKILRERAAQVDPNRIAPPPLLTGDDLQALGLRPGPRLGEAARHLYRAQLNERVTTREEAIRFIQKWNERHP